MSSLLSLSGPRTPKLNRKSRDNDKTVTIKCQRLNSERQYEEVEVEVPAPIYDTLRFYNSESSASSGLDTTSSRGSRQSDKHDYNLNKNRTFSAKIRSLFGSRTWNIKRFIMTSWDYKFSDIIHDWMVNPEPFEVFVQDNPIKPEVVVGNQVFATNIF